jgi:hypothetical protein
VAGTKNTDLQAVRNPRAKFITLALLVAWVVGVFAFTLWKFSAIAR